MATTKQTLTLRFITLLSLFISLNLAWFASPSEVHAQVSPGTWVQFEFTPSKTILHVRTDSVLQRMSDSLRTVRDAMAMLPGLYGDGLVDRLAYWINDSTLSLWMPISEVQTAMNMAAGMRDSSWLGRYDVSSDLWDTPEYVDEPPYPDWFTKDWRKWEKYGLYVDPASPLQLKCHPRGDSVMVFEFKLPKARLLDFLGFDTTANTEFPRIVAYINNENVTSIVDSGSNIQIQALPGLRFSHARNGTGDTLTLELGIDWSILRDSVLVWAPGGSGATTFTGLTDTPADYTGFSGKVVKVNPTETALVFADDNTGGSGAPQSMVFDTSNVILGDSVYYWEGRWMRPRLVYSPNANYVYGGDSLFMKTAMGWKEYEVHFVRMNGTANPVHLEFDVVADSANGRFLYAVQITGDAAAIIGSSATGTFGSHWLIHVHPASSATFYTAVRSPTIRSGGTASYPSIGGFESPGASVAADGYKAMYLFRVRLNSLANFPAFWPMTIRIYYGRRLDTPEGNSTWDVKLENI